MAIKKAKPHGQHQQVSRDGGEHYAGEFGKETAEFAKPFDAVSPGVGGLGGVHDDIGEKSGFEADTGKYIVKKGSPYGEAAKFNFLPPGMDISNQEMADIYEMPLKKVIEESYPGDGWEPSPKDIPE